MPYSKEHKAQSREQILLSASRLFPRKGFDAASVDELMRMAGLTRGAFYNHFSNMGELYAESILYASACSPFTHEKNSAASDSELFVKTVDSYLSRGHIDHAELPCPLTFLVPDIQMDIDKYIDALTATNSINGIMNVGVGLAESLGCDYFLYARIEQVPISSPKVTLVGNYPPKWMLRYQEKEYAKNDPTVWHVTH